MGELEAFIRLVLLTFGNGNLFLFLYLFLVKYLVYHYVIVKYKSDMYSRIEMSSTLILFIKCI